MTTLDAHPRRKNRDVAAVLDEIADLLEIKGDQRYRVNAYRTAARRIEAHSEPIEEVFAQRKLTSIRGVGEALEQKITELLATGRLDYLERLRREVPGSLVSLLDVPGLGPKTAHQIYQQLGISNLDQLEQAAREHRLSGLPGIGDKTEENILAELQRLKERSKRYVLTTALERAETLLAELRKHPAVDRAEFAGSLRRCQETIGDLDLLVTTTDAPTVHEYFRALPQVVDVISTGPSRTTVLVGGGMQVDLRVVPPESFGAALLYFTGSKEHNIQLREIAIRNGWRLNEYGLFDERSGQPLARETERDIYALFGMDCPPPEIRLGAGEIEAARAHTLPALATRADLKGDLHLHTNWTDGAHTLEEMAAAAIAQGHAYMAVTDHSQSLRVARGLNPEQLREQRRLVDELNARVAPFRILQGTELDILADGSLDFEDDVLETLDYVSVSIHSAMKQPRDEMTARICRALTSPWVTTFNHPHGRLLTQRDAYAVDMDAVIDTAIEHGVALEVNSQPHRLDLDGGWVRRVVDRGGCITISSDAHTVDQLGLLRYGVMTARRGWATPARVLNGLPLDRFMEHCRVRRP